MTASWESGIYAFADAIRTPGQLAVFYSSRNVSRQMRLNRTTLLKSDLRQPVNCRWKGDRMALSSVRLLGDLAMTHHQGPRKLEKTAAMSRGSESLRFVDRMSTDRLCANIQFHGSRRREVLG